VTPPTRVGRFPPSVWDRDRVSISDAAAAPESAPGGRGFVRRHVVALVITGVLTLAVIAAFMHWLAGHDGFSTIDETSGHWAYLSVFLLVFGDAVIPILPGETTLNAASTLAASGALELSLIILFGAAGAIIGDSTLYWIARRNSHRVQPQVDKARANPKVGTALDFIGSSAPALLVAGRYVPGMRFVINSTMGLTKYPYRKFIVWSAIGGALWSVYTCCLAYVIATALSGFPLASVVISGVVTTIALAVIYVVIRRRRRQLASTASAG